VDSKKEHQPQGWDVRPDLKASLRTRTSVWIGLAAIVGWLLSHVPAKRRRTYVHGSDQGEKHHPEEITLSAKTKHPKGRGGLLSLAIELLGAVAIRLLQRYLKSWSSTLIVTLKNRQKTGRLPEAFPARLRQKILVTCTISDPKYHQRSLRRTSLTQKV
jgi:hypothetical protein